MSDNKDYLTAGEAAKALGVSHTTLIKLFENGDVKGYLVPGSKHRRISKDSVRKLLIECGRPAEHLDAKGA